MTIDVGKPSLDVTDELEALFRLMDIAVCALDKDTYSQSLRDEFDAPDDADYSVCAGTVRKCNAVFAAIEKIRAILTGTAFIKPEA